MARRGLREATAAIVDTAIAELDDVQLSGPMRVVSKVAGNVLKRHHDYAKTISDAERLHAELTGIQHVLGRCVERLRAEERRTGEALPGGEVWWNARKRQIADGLAHEADRSTGVRSWEETWALGVAFQAWEQVKQVLDFEGLPARSEPTKHEMAAATDALRRGDYLSAARDLESLLAVPGTKPGFQVLVGALRTRALSTAMQEQLPAWHAAQATVQYVEEGLANDLPRGEEASRIRSVAFAVRAEVELAGNWVEDARGSVDRALTQTTVATEAYVVAGLLAERDGAWPAADAFYDKALKARETLVTRRTLFQPTPARLLLRAAEDQAPVEAVGLIQEALSVGIAGEGEHPDRDVYITLAQQLEMLAADAADEHRDDDASQLMSEAARAYTEAGQRFAWMGLPQQAIELFGLACALAPTEPRHRWSLAEGLRLDAQMPGGLVDSEGLERAREELQRGLDLGDPDESSTWVLLTQGLIDIDLADDGEDPVVPFERAIIKAADSGDADTQAFAYGLLVLALRRQGYPFEAAEAGWRGDALRSSDPLVFSELVYALIDLGEYEKALDRIELELLFRPDSPDVIVAKSTALLRLGRASKALDALDGLESTADVRLIRAECYNAQQNDPGAAAEFQWLRRETSEDSEPSVYGRAAYRTGRLDDAIRIYRACMDRAPRQLSYRRELGQFLLVDGKVAEGRRLLLEGIEESPFVDELVRLPDELAYVRQQVNGSADGDAVADVVEEAVVLAKLRCAELRGRRRTGGAAVQLAAAREAMQAGDYLVALTTYVALQNESAVPEAAIGLRSAASRALAVADDVFQSGNADQAKEGWAALRRISADTGLADVGVEVGLICRQVLLCYQEGIETPEDRTKLLRCLDTAYPELDRAATVLACDIGRLWSLSDALHRVVSSGSLTATEETSLRWLMQDLPWSRAYGLADQSSDELSSSPGVTPLDVHVGRRHMVLSESPGLYDEIRELQQRISDDFGVRIPWVYVTTDDKLGEDDVDFRVYDRSMKRLELDGDDASAKEQFLGLVEETVHEHLYRFVGVDDVRFWLEGWDDRSPQESIQLQHARLVDRLRLARVLRMLLREGATVRDRQTIVDAVEAAGSDDETSILPALRRARTELGREALGVPANWDAVPLPEGLERLVSSTMDDGGTMWQLGREPTHELVGQLREWLATLPPADRVISVANALVRPYVWRLLASERPRVHVLAMEEL